MTDPNRRPSATSDHADRPTTGQGQARYLWRVLSVTSIGLVLSGTNTSTLDVALPVVVRHLQANATQANWIVLSYMLVNTVLILVFGRIADIVGRRRLYLAGLGTLTLASTMCGLAPSAVVLSGFRAIQAIGAAALITNTTAMITDAAPPALLSRALGFNVSVASASQVAGPVIGGLFASTLGWRWVFWYNVPVGVIGLAWGLLSLRPDPAKTTRERFDPAGAALAFTLIGGIVLALSEGGAVGWASPPVWIGGACALVSMPAFVVSQRRSPHPMLDLGLFRERSRSLAYAAAFLMSVARFALVLLVALYLQAASGTSPFQAGVRVIPVAAGISMISPVAGRLAGRYPARWVASAGMAVTIIALVVLAAIISPQVPYPAVGACLLAVGIGAGTFMTPNTTSIMSTVPANRRGIANGLRSMLQNAGYVVSTAMSLAIVTSPLNRSDKRLAYAGTLSELSRHSLAAFTQGYRTAFLVLAAACAAGLAASLSRSGRQDRRGHPGVPSPRDRAGDLT